MGVDQRPSRPTCAEPGGGEFPVRTRIHGGPAEYDAGGGFRTWYIDLTNTTDATCGNIHPVVVLVDGKRALRPEQPRLEFYDGDRPRPVGFERTDQDENIGVLGSPVSRADGSDTDSSEADEAPFPGFTVAPGATLSVKVRLAVTSDAVANEVVAHAAVVQRQGDDGDDGDWVGQSNDYRFRILGEGEGEGEGAGDGDGGEKGEVGGKDGAAITGDRDRADASPRVPDGIPFAEELARTGLHSTRGVVAATAGALLLLGAGLGALLAARRRR
ncbi:hypothetical protein [Streptomyces sp. NPDC058656]|uniref:hypothetical protein n=1 Tax=Streptomyces sp. NPDC058656 TaxID=3346578 RepID=UPI0036619CF2